MRPLILLLMLIGTEAHADYFGGLGQGIRINDQAGGSGSMIFPAYSLAIGKTFKEWAIQAETVHVTRESGAGNVLLSVRQFDYLVWIRRSFAKSFWNPFLEVGGGLQQSHIDTHFAQSVTHSQGEPTGMVGVGLGIQSRVPKSMNFIFELRYLNGSQFRSVTSFESISRLIYQL